MNESEGLSFWVLFKSDGRSFCVFILICIDGGFEVANKSFWSARLLGSDILMFIGFTNFLFDDLYVLLLFVNFSSLLLDIDSRLLLCLMAWVSTFLSINFLDGIFFIDGVKSLSLGCLLISFGCFGVGVNSLGSPLVEVLGVNLPWLALS